MLEAEENSSGCPVRAFSRGVALLSQLGLNGQQSSSRLLEDTYLYLPAAFAAQVSANRSRTHCDRLERDQTPVCL